MRIGIAIALMTLVAACGGSEPTSTEEPITPDGTWSSVTAVLDARCASCHVGGGPEDELSIRPYSCSAIVAGTAQCGPLVLVNAPPVSGLLAIPEGMHQAHPFHWTSTDDAYVVVQTWIAAGAPCP